MTDFDDRHRSVAEAERAEIWVWISGWALLFIPPLVVLTFIFAAVVWGILGW